MMLFPRDKKHHCGSRKLCFLLFMWWLHQDGRRYSLETVWLLPLCFRLCWLVGLRWIQELLVLSYWRLLCSKGRCWWLLVQMFCLLVSGEGRHPQRRSIVISPRRWDWCGGKANLAVFVDVCGGNIWWHLRHFWAWKGGRSGFGSPNQDQDLGSVALSNIGKWCNALSGQLWDCLRVSFRFISR